ncbi:MOSC domain-containing protein [Candidatus Omnitrophota bacterium]
MADTGENKGKIFSINYSSQKRTSKTAVAQAKLIKDFGLEGDAHAGAGLRQLSLLAIESINKQAECPKVKKSDLTLKPGDFAENITTQGLDLAQLKIGDRLNVGAGVILEISKIGKECHQYCAIYKKLGDCIMPREGIFAKVVQGGAVSVGEEIEVIRDV